MSEIVVPPHPWPQEDFYDSYCVPWTYNSSTGVLMSERLVGEGDGMYVYVEDETAPRGIGVALNPRRGDSDSRYRERMRVMIDEVFELARATDTRDARAIYTSSEEEEDSDDAESDDHAASEEVDRRVKRTAEVKRRAPTTSSGDLALEGCQVTSRPRPGSKRCDLKITTPDGRVFRSKAAALRYLEGPA